MRNPTAALILSALIPSSAWSSESVERLDPALDQIIPLDAAVETLCTGFQWAEGPVWDPEEDHLLFSDVPNNTIYRWSEGDTKASVWMKPSGYTGVDPNAKSPGSNGLAIDQEGRLVLCEHGDRRVAVLTRRGGKRTIADHYRSRRFNSPNDLTIASDGTIYFTDPTYGIHEEFRDLDYEGVYRISPNGTVTLVTKDYARPNGIALSPDEKTLYVARSDRSFFCILAFSLNEDGSFGEGVVFFDARELEGPGSCDGLKVASDGTIFSTGPGGVLVISPEGRLLGRVLCGRPTANVAIGPDHLYITSKDRVLRVPITTEEDEEPPAAKALQSAAESFLRALDEPHRIQASFSFDSQERQNWHYVPKDRLGVPLKDLNEAQKNATVGMIVAAMSEVGALKAAQIILLEGVLAAIEDRPEFRDPEKYYAAVFGTPGDKNGWGFRMEGHHLSVNVTVVGGDQISVTPSFMGANPAEVREGPSEGMRPLAPEEDLARALAVSLTEAGKKAIFDDAPPKEILSGADRVATQLEPVGIRAADMTSAQRDTLFEVIAEYTGRHRDDLAAADLQRIRQDKPDEIRFGWAGSLKLGEAYYYRIQGPSFLIEAANVQNKANHIHTVWRDLRNDFGRDLIRQHMEEHHE